MIFTLFFSFTLFLFWLNYFLFHLPKQYLIITSSNFSPIHLSPCYSHRQPCRSNPAPSYAGSASRVQRACRRACRVPPPRWAVRPRRSSFSNGPAPPPASPRVWARISALPRSALPPRSPGSILSCCVRVSGIFGNSSPSTTLSRLFAYISTP